MPFLIKNAQFELNFQNLYGLSYNYVHVYSYSNTRTSVECHEIGLNHLSNFYTSFSVINSGLIRVELDVSAPGDLKKPMRWKLS